MPRRRLVVGECILQRDASLHPSPPEFVAPLYAFLASDLARDVTGKLFTAAGGYVGLHAPMGGETMLAFRDPADGPWPVDALARGWPCHRVNAAALDALRRAGLGETIRHRIGHGMGVEGHEAPWLAPGDATPAAPGMVFSCEPGVYRPGIDGWRTIDTLVVGAGSVELASRFPARHPLRSRVLT